MKKIFLLKSTGINNSLSTFDDQFSLDLYKIPKYRRDKKDESIRLII